MSRTTTAIRPAVRTGKLQPRSRAPALYRSLCHAASEKPRLILNHARVPTALVSFIAQELHHLPCKTFGIPRHVVIAHNANPRLPADLRRKLWRLQKPANLLREI